MGVLMRRALVPCRPARGLKTVQLPQRVLTGHSAPQMPAYVLNFVR